jgi:hypothetical protein
MDALFLSSSVNLLSKEESMCTASPFNVRAVKDSEELELSLDINNAAVRCDKIKVKVPLRGSRHHLPIEVTASYADRQSPAKQAKITSYLNPRPGSRREGRPEAAAARAATSAAHHNAKNVTASTSSDLGILVVGKANKETVLKWKTLFEKSVPDQKLHRSEREEEEELASEGRNGEGRKRKCPFYKLLPNTSFAVDAFNYGQISGVRYYFLSHYHFDHYQVPSTIRL